MSKAPEAFRTISEVAECLETPAHVLRFWESKFAQVKPVKRAGGRRYYRPADMMLLGGIKRLLHQDGLTIKGVQKLLRDKGAKHVAGLCSLSLDEEQILEGQVAEDVDAMKDAPPSSEPIFSSVVPERRAASADNVVPFRHDSDSQMAFPGFEFASERGKDDSDVVEAEASPHQPDVEERINEAQPIDISHIPEDPISTQVSCDPGILTLLAKHKMAIPAANDQDVKEVIENLTAIVQGRAGSGKS